MIDTIRRLEDELDQAERLIAIRDKQIKTLRESLLQCVDFIESLPYQPSNSTSTRAQDAGRDALASLD